MERRGVRGVFCKLPRDLLSRITAEPHPSHPGMNIYARNKDGSIAYRLCAIDSELSLFSADGTKYWAK